MSNMELLKEKLDEDLKECGNLPIADALAKARAKTMQTVTDFLKEKGLWDGVKDQPPGKFIVVTTLPNDASVVAVHVSDYLQDLLK